MFWMIEPSSPKASSNIIWKKCEMRAQVHKSNCTISRQGECGSAASTERTESSRFWLTKVRICPQYDAAPETDKLTIGCISRNRVHQPVDVADIRPFSAYKPAIAYSST